MLGLLDAFGRSTLTACVSNGAVMMKITSSTSITSMSGIMLISAIGAVLPSLLKPPKAMSGAALGTGGGRFHRHDRRRLAHVRAGGEHRVEVVRERIQARQHQAVGAHETVVGEHRGD